MDIFSTYAALSISFVMLASIILWIFIKADNISWKKKLFTIPIVLAYSIVLLFTMQDYPGHASYNVKGLNQVIVLDYHSVEGDAIYFWILDYNKNNVLATYFPRHPDASKADAPIYVAIEYNSDVHKALVKMVLEMEMKMQGRGKILANMEKLSGFSALIDSENPFDLQDPMEMLKKAPQE